MNTYYFHDVTNQKMIAAPEYSKELAERAIAYMARLVLPSTRLAKNYNYWECFSEISENEIPPNPTEEKVMTFLQHCDKPILGIDPYATILNTAYGLSKGQPAIRLLTILDAQCVYGTWFPANRCGLIADAISSGVKAGILPEDWDTISQSLFDTPGDVYISAFDNIPCFSWNGIADRLDHLKEEKPDRRIMTLDDNYYFGDGFDLQKVNEIIGYIVSGQWTVKKAYAIAETFKSNKTLLPEQAWKLALYQGLTE